LFPHNFIKHLQIATVSPEENCPAITAFFPFDRFDRQADLIRHRKIRETGNGFLLPVKDIAVVCMVIMPVRRVITIEAFGVDHQLETRAEICTDMDAKIKFAEYLSESVCIVPAVQLR
jgi:hypothetical protein